MNVLIADDERIVLDGLKHIIDWSALGFSICDQASNGEEALEKILSLNPDLVMLDIRMPKMSGIEVVKAASRQGFLGKFIILSGVSDFKLAQTAMRYGVDFYLTKPLDEEELEQAVIAIRDSIQEEYQNRNYYEHYRSKARQSILTEILNNTCDYQNLNPKELHLNANVYQVLSYENYNQNYYHTAWNFADLLRVTNQDNHSFDIIELDHHNIVLLKGDLAISKFENMLHHYNRGPEKGSPFDSVFLVYGQKVSRISDIHLSYETVTRLSNRRFFCKKNQHIIGYTELSHMKLIGSSIEKEDAPHYAGLFSDFIQSYNQTMIHETLKELTEFLYHTSSEVSRIRHFLIDIYILVKQKLSAAYRNTDIPFLTNTAAIDLIDNKFYLYEIMAFLAEQFDLLTHAVGYSSGENVLDEVLYYIQNNYHENLKLESIAPIFGYNSSYLGKIFTKNVGMSFNHYLDMIRIRESKKLLEQQQLKIYEIAERVGYSNVDYFHKKFKKHVGTSPVEYRKQYLP